MLLQKKFLEEITKENFLEGIRKEYEKGTDLRNHKVPVNSARGLFRANRTYKFYNSWQNALIAAEEKFGINIIQQNNGRTDEERKERAFKLSLELKKLYDKGVALNVESLEDNKTYFCLYKRARNLYFKTHGKFFWEHALEKAGIDPKQVVLRCQRDKESIKRWILTRAKEGKPLHFSSVSKTLEGRCYIAAANRNFKSSKNFLESPWDCALRYAGFDPKQIRLRQRYAKEEIIATIIKKYFEGANLRKQAIIKGKDEELRQKMYAALKLTGNWTNFLSSLGISYPFSTEHNQKFRDLNLSAQKIKDILYKLSKFSSQNINYISPDFEKATNYLNNILNERLRRRYFDKRFKELKKEFDNLKPNEKKQGFLNYCKEKVKYTLEKVKKGQMVYIPVEDHFGKVLSLENRICEKKEEGEDPLAICVATIELDNGKKISMFAGEGRYDYRKKRIYKIKHKRNIP